MLLVPGLLVWSLVHFIPSLSQPLKSKWLNGMGSTGYKLSYSLIVVLSIVMMVFGWCSISPTVLYTLPGFTRPIGMLLMVFAFMLFGAAHHVTRIKQVFRRPQLASIICLIIRPLADKWRQPIHGFGDLGKAMARVLNGFRSEISVFDPWLPPSMLEERGVHPTQ